MTIKKFTIYGERCSGTNYLEELIKLNFKDIEITWKYGWKHFFGHQEDRLKDSEDTLFICIIRDFHSWINSFFRHKHHIPLRDMKHLPEDVQIDFFLNNEFFSCFNDSQGKIDPTKEIMIDRHIYTGKRYKNIFEMRHVKNYFLIEELPYKVKNYILIRYEDLLDDFRNTMIRIKNKGLVVKNPQTFPINTNTYKKYHNLKYDLIKKTKHDTISKDMILKNKGFIPYYEEKLKYIR